MRSNKSSGAAESGGAGTLFLSIAVFLFVVVVAVGCWSLLLLRLLLAMLILFLFVVCSVAVDGAVDNGADVGVVDLDVVTLVSAAIVDGNNSDNCFGHFGCCNSGCLVSAVRCTFVLHMLLLDLSIC